MEKRKPALREISFTQRWCVLDRKSPDYPYTADTASEVILLLVEQSFCALPGNLLNILLGEIVTWFDAVHPRAGHFEVFVGAAQYFISIWNRFSRR